MVRVWRVGLGCALWRIVCVSTVSAYPAGLLVGGFVALQRDAGCGLQALGDEFLAGVDVRVGGVADHDAGRLKAFGGDARVAFADQ